MNYEKMMRKMLRLRHINGHYKCAATVNRKTHILSLQFQKFEKANAGGLDGLRMFSVEIGHHVLLLLA